MTWNRLSLALLIAVMAPALAWSQVVNGDPHVALRAEQGLPASSAAGEIRVFGQAYLSGGGASSLVARREPSGRWTVSWVRQGPRRGDAVLSWSLGRTAEAALEELLDDPGVLAPEPIPPEFGNCLDPPFVRMDVTWKGRTQQIEQSCGTWGAVRKISDLLESGMP